MIDLAVSWPPISSFFMTNKGDTMFRQQPIPSVECFIWKLLIGTLKMRYNGVLMQLKAAIVRLGGKEKKQKKQNRLAER